MKGFYASSYFFFLIDDCTTVVPGFPEWNVWDFWNLEYGFFPHHFLITSYFVTLFQFIQSQKKVNFSVL